MKELILQLVLSMGIFSLASGEIPFADPAVDRTNRRLRFMTHRCAQVIFSRVDVDHDKQLDASEQAALFAKGNSDGWAIAQEAGSKDAAIQAMDTSADGQLRNFSECTAHVSAGVISSDEFLSATVPRFHRGVAEQDFASQDIDEDGNLNLEEFKNTNYVRSNSLLTAQLPSTLFIHSVPGQRSHVSWCCRQLTAHPIGKMRNLRLASIWSTLTATAL